MTPHASTSAQFHYHCVHDAVATVWTDRYKGKAAVNVADISKMSKEERRRLREQLTELSDDE